MDIKDGLNSSIMIVLIIDDWQVRGSWEVRQFMIYFVIDRLGICERWGYVKYIVLLTGLDSLRGGNM